MSKWINDRAWTVSMYICYALCFIILCVAGYNFTMGIIGETSSIMKVVLLICIILFVGFGVSMIFSIFITPLSELLSRLLWHLFRLKTKKAISPNIDAKEKSIEANTTANDSNRNALKDEFVQSYVKSDCAHLPIYDVFESLFDQEKSGAFAARAFKCALSDPNWLKAYPGYIDAQRLFPHKDAIKGNKSNYSKANNNKDYTEETIKETESLLKDKLKELEAKSATLQN